MVDTSIAVREARAAMNTPEGRDPRSVVSAWHEQTYGLDKSIQIRLYFHDPLTVKRHLQLIQQEVARTLEEMSRVGVGNETALIVARGRMRTLAKMLNAYRRLSRSKDVHKTYGTNSD